MQRISHYHVKMMLQHAIHDMLWLQETKGDIWGFVGLWTMGVKSVDGVMQLCDGCAVLSVLVRSARSCSSVMPVRLVCSGVQCQVAMAADGMGGRDAASLLASLATLQHTPK